MRYIDRNLLVLPDGWLDRAKVAADAVANGAEPDAHSHVWGELKHGLADVFHDKCWYCENKITRSDNAVDHFRPKGRVSDALNAHIGYRWLAFDRSNFRYACTFCNSRRTNVAGGTAGGKADRFPLLDEAQRVYAKGPTVAERPALLDPCALGDWRLLGCKQENGKPCATSNYVEEKQRAETSIEIYHLHHEPTCKLRHSAAVQLLQEIDDAKVLFVASQTDAGQETAFKKAAERILRAISSKSPFSGDMHFILRAHRSDEHPWIQNLLET